MYAYIAFIGMLLIFAGFALLFVYALLSASSSASKEGSNISAGGLIMIGPFPIAFGTSPSMLIVVEVLAIILIILAILFFFLMRW
jgi:uncharacterized protein (TIGR00304 family)